MSPAEGSHWLCWFCVSIQARLTSGTPGPPPPPAPPPPPLAAPAPWAAPSPTRFWTEARVWLRTAAQQEVGPPQRPHHPWEGGGVLMPSWDVEQTSSCRGSRPDHCCCSWTEENVQLVLIHWVCAAFKNSRRLKTIWGLFWGGGRGGVSVNSPTVFQLNEPSGWHKLLVWGFISTVSVCLSHWEWRQGVTDTAEGLPRWP